MNLPRNFYAQLQEFTNGHADFVAGRGAEVCESPIEVAFYTAFKMLGLTNYGPVAHVGKGGGKINDHLWPTFEWFIWPQYEWTHGRRVDFLIGEYLESENRAQIAIECDGHDYHERTKEQAERDRSRDRELQSDGLTVFRFTGREIYRNAFACASDAFDHLRATQDKINEMVK